MNDKDKELYKTAKRRVIAKKGFKIHLVVYIAVSILLFVISKTGNQNWWIYPVLGWGIGVVTHGVSLYSALGTSKEIQKELELLRKQQK